MRIFAFDSSVFLEKPIGEVFRFFSDAFNLPVITPPWVHFEVLTPPPIQMAQGTRLQYRLRLRGIPLRWESRISVWEPPRRFVDEQTRGPYRLWRHEHLFAERGCGTECSDHVEYATIGGAVANRFLVAPDLSRIFAYRKRKLEELFSGSVGARL
ncbi:MAG TPA: SRPBCC family protein [Verrucomicrobiae bacterium]|nr:SRPBCC family protein [Verrucomicrobiae bacterium]